MSRPVRILLQTTIPTTVDDWSIERFSLLREHLASLKDGAGNSRFDVTARDRESDAEGNDPVLSTLDASEFDELWLFAVDTGDGLTKDDCKGITRFRQRGGGILATRDHQDLGSSLCTLGGVGRAHFFHTQNPEPDESRHRPDDTYTTSILWPNYHSGRNGDYQKIEPVEPLHELLRNPASTSGVIEDFPAHPHEGAVGVPEDEHDARVIAVGHSLVSGQPFNLAVVFESAKDDHGNLLGRAVAQSSFHHFVDYNWDTSVGCPSFVLEAPGDGYEKEPRALEDIKTYVGNVAAWLALPAQAK
ncbi:MAG: hypothetical protein WCF57_24090 [Pyrinomonadaceae bacterium]